MSKAEQIIIAALDQGPLFFEPHAGNGWYFPSPYPMETTRPNGPVPRVRKRYFRTMDVRRVIANGQAIKIGNVLVKKPQTGGETMKIASPGIYNDFPEAAYFADPCPEPSLTQSVAKILLDQSPAHARLAHPRLAWEAEQDEDGEKYNKARAIGNAAHKLMLGRGRDVVALDFDNMRSKAAQEQHAAALAAGQLPVLAKHYDQAENMVVAAREQLALSDYPDIFTKGNSEIVLAWKEAGLWFRSLIDWSRDLRVVVDYKTSAMCCSPYIIDTRASDIGWDVQGAFHERGLDVLDPDNAGRREHIFIAQENYAPYALTVVRISEADLTLGRKKLAMAADLWARCLRANKWPAYSMQTVMSRPKPWTETKTLEREIAHHESGDRVTPMLRSLAGG